MTASPRLLELLAGGEFDWDDPRHREAYLRTWVKTGNRLLAEVRA